MDEAAYQKGQSVSLLRRMVAWGIDWIVIGLAERLLQFGLSFIPAYRVWAANYSDLVSHLWFFVMVFLVFMVLPFITNGQTFGKKVVRIRIVGKKREHISLRALVVRYGYLYFLYGLISWYMASGSQLLNSDNRLLQVVAFILYLSCLALLLLFIVSVCATFIQKKRRLFYEKASHTYTISTIQVQTSTKIK